MPQESVCSKAPLNLRPLEDPISSGCLAPYHLRRVCGASLPSTWVRCGGIIGSGELSQVLERSCEEPPLAGSPIPSTWNHVSKLTVESRGINNHELFAIGLIDTKTGF